MTRKLILALSTIAALASPMLVSNAYAWGGHGGGGMHGGMGGHGGGFGGHWGGHGGHWGHPHWAGQWKHHFYPRFYAHRYYPAPVVSYAVSRPVANTCNCLTKEYTPDGSVIFKDVCTKEMASAPLPGSPAAAAIEAPQQTAAIQPAEPQNPNNFAGRTFQDYQNSNQPK